MQERLLVLDLEGGKLNISAFVTEESEKKRPEKKAKCGKKKWLGGGGKDTEN